MTKGSALQTGIYVIILILVTIVFHSIEFRVAAWNVDEYVFATGGQKILSGGMLYRDFGDNKPPLIYHTYSLIRQLSGGDFLRFLFISKICTMTVVFLTALGVFYIGMTLGGRGQGMIAGLLYAAYTICAQGSEVLGGRSELYASLMMTASICFFVRKRFEPGIADLLASGLLLSLAALYNTRFGILIVVYFIFLLYRHGIEKKAFIDMTALAMSFLAPLAVVPMYYYYAGAFDAYTFWQSTVIKYYLEACPVHLRLLSGLLIFYFFAGLAPVAILAAFNVIRTIRREYPLPRRQAQPGPENRSKRLGAFLSRISLWLRDMFTWNYLNEAFIFLLVMLGCMYGAFFSGGIPGVRYFYMMFVPLSLLGARGFSDVWRKAARMLPDIEAAVIVKVTMISFLILVPVYFYAIHLQTEKPSIYECRDTYKPVVDYISANTREGDTIYVWYSMSPIYLYSNRLPATCMVFPAQFLLRYYYFVGDFQSETTSWDIFLTQLKREKPALIVDDTDGFSTRKGKMVLYSRKSRYVEKKAEEMRRFIKNNYRYIDDLQGFKLYRRV